MHDHVLFIEQKEEEEKKKLEFEWYEKCPHIPENSPHLGLEESQWETTMIRIVQKRETTLNGEGPVNSPHTNMWRYKREKTSIST